MQSEGRGAARSTAGIPLQPLVLWLSHMFRSSSLFVDIMQALQARTAAVAQREAEVEQREKTVEVLVSVTQDLAKSHKEEAAAVEEVCFCLMSGCASGS